MLRTICEDFLKETMEYNDLPGLAVGVVRGGEEWTGAAGFRDRESKTPLQPEDIFHCASVSKLFTSSAIMKLTEAGILDLEDRLADILPELTIADKRYEDVKLWQMLSHTAGIGDVDDYHWEEAIISPEALSDYVHSEEVTGLPLLWEPGKGGFRYSNIAFEILGHIVASRSAQLAGRQLSYEDFVKKYLMEPAGMEDSTMLTFERLGVDQRQACPLITSEIRRRNEEAAAGWKPMAMPYEKAQDRSIVPVRYYPYTRSHGPSSTLTSNVGDLIRWMKANMAGFALAEEAERDGRIFGRPESPQAASMSQAAGQAQETGTPQAADQDPKTGTPQALSPWSYQHIRYEYAEVPNNREKMGLGWFMRRQAGHQLYGHEGTDDGFRASVWICPELQTGIAVLCNLSGAPVKRLNKQLFERLLPEG